MQKYWDTPTHDRGPRLYQSTAGAVLGDSTKLQPSLETAQYPTPYFMSKGELPQTARNSLKTVQVSRLGANEQTEHIQPACIAQSQNSKKHQLDIEIDTGAGCNVMPLYKVQELFDQE